MTQPQSVSKSNFKSKVRYYCNAPSRFIASVNAALIAGMMSLSPTLCLGTTNTNLMNSLFGSMVDIICQIAFYVGAIMLIGGVFAWLLAQKDDNADAQSRAIKFIVVGLALASLKFLVSPLIQGLGLTA